MVLVNQWCLPSLNPHVWWLHPSVPWWKVGLHSHIAGFRPSNRDSRHIPIVRIPVVGWVTTNHRLVAESTSFVGENCENPAYSGKISNFFGWIRKEISLTIINKLNIIYHSFIPFFPNDLTAVPFQLPRSLWSSVSGTALAELIRQMANGWVQRPFPWGYHGDFDSTSCSYRWWGYGINHPPADIRGILRCTNFSSLFFQFPSILLVVRFLYVFAVAKSSTSCFNGRSLSHEGGFTGFIQRGAGFRWPISIHSMIGKGIYDRKTIGKP